MNTLEKLKQEVQALEDSVNAETPQEEMLEALLIAYHKMKDMVKVYEEAVPTTNDNDVVIDDLKAQIAVLETANEIYEKELTEAAELHKISVKNVNMLNEKLDQIAEIVK